MEPQWLTWAKQIQSIAQAGLAYSRDVYDLERFGMLRDLAVEIVENHTKAGREPIRLAFASEEGYATPKVDVRGVVFREGRILLVREKIDGAWSLPGGWADIGLSPSEIAVKEIREEAGYDTEAVRLLAVMDKKFHDHPPDLWHIYKIFILCRLTGGEGIGSEGTLETSDVGFFGPDELPELSVGRNTKAQILTMFEFLHDPHKAVLLD
ncbi:NUDIX hydrolase [Paenibacillus mucilaginosus]|uniref:YjhB n=3 Tax=Paenibacillus mucilaginosus TaxID=61624 RepID=H6NTB2_9BACL|nr:NUDIX hydrolase [Paenibacillus mucilaginosus]AEI39293.1 YjhB [Paenibacillus mucilaginosus KNP414]AFC27574.1 YjhB [Paenibacillus mucilaginosus 3016]AFH59728.1 ADP-ribose pyrophosphatase [Paenibacillus mucilaginosus K02]MCG7216999.1 NUDIX hydrolase [Paenibacillus mucilaginosus]WDM28292.1 NUDIX hydrolase [Paenibacillus mucilaginosus]